MTRSRMKLFLVSIIIQSVCGLSIFQDVNRLSDVPVNIQDNKFFSNDLTIEILYNIFKNLTSSITLVLLSSLIQFVAYKLTETTSLYGFQSLLVLYNSATSTKSQKLYNKLPLLKSYHFQFSFGLSLIFYSALLTMSL